MGWYIPSESGLASDDFRLAKDDLSVRDVVISVEGFIELLSKSTEKAIDEVFVKSALFIIERNCRFDVNSVSKVKSLHDLSEKEVRDEYKQRIVSRYNSYITIAKGYCSFENLRPDIEQFIQNIEKILEPISE